MHAERTEAVDSLSVGMLEDRGDIEIAVGFPSGEHNAVGHGVPHIRPFNVTTAGTIALDQIKYVPPSEKQERLTLQQGDVVFNNTNSKELVGKTAFWDKAGAFTFSNHMTRIRVRSGELSPQYIAYALHHHWMVGESQKLCRPHVAQASIIGERLREILLPMPPPHEQTGIAALLHSVQRAALVQAQILSRAATLKSRLMGQLFTRGLRGEAQKETPHGLVPDHWAIRLLEHCAAVQTGVTKGRKLDGGDLIDVPYLRVANVQSGFLDLSEIKHIKIRREELARYRLQADDIVLTEGGDLDKLGRGFIWRGEIEDCVHQNHIFAVRVDRTLLDPEYFAYLVQSAYGRSYFLMVGHKTTNLASINSTKLKAFPVLIPPLEEQREIAHILDAIDRKIDLHRRKRDVLDELFRSLLHKLMRGEIRVNDLSMPEITQ